MNQQKGYHLLEQNNYIPILIDSLQKKKKVLEEIILKNEEQSIIIRDNLDLGAFDENTKEKDKRIRQLELLDQGFQSIYERIREDFVAHKSQYPEEIVQMQKLIGEITERSVAIQASEERNRQMIEQYFSYARKNLQKTRTSVKAASNYYKSMSQLTPSEPKTIDEKK